MANGDSEVSRIVDQLEREHAGEPWHGSPLVGILAASRISRRRRGRSPVRTRIWELVLHITAWKNEVRQRLRGAPAGEPQRGRLARPPVGAERRRVAPGARRARGGAPRARRQPSPVFADPQLFEPTNDPRADANGSARHYYQLLHGIVQHDVYHAGQIAMLKKGVVASRWSASPLDRFAGDPSSRRPASRS